MALYKPNETKIILPRHGFLVDTDNLELLIDNVKTGCIIHLPPDLTSKIAPGLSANPNAMYFAASGIAISHDYDGSFQQGQTLLAVEMVRYESNPVVSQKEPNFNLNRYVFGRSSIDDKAYGIDVTTWESNPVTSQVGNHWDEIENYIQGHFPPEYGGELK